MALLKCTECDEEISSKEKKCPYCGCPRIEILKQFLKQKKAVEGDEASKVINKKNFSVICPECDEKISADLETCPECGYPMKKFKPSLNFTKSNVNAQNKNIKSCGLENLFSRYSSIVVFDTETSGLDFNKDQIIEFASVQLKRNSSGIYIENKIDTLINLYNGNTISQKAMEINNITQQMLNNDGKPWYFIINELIKIFDGKKILLVAHNAHFDLKFLYNLFKKDNLECHFRKIDILDTLTIFKDRRPYPHKLSDAILEYKLQYKVSNSHRAIDDVMALIEVLFALDNENSDLDKYINLFGYNPKYKINSYDKFPNIIYKQQPYNMKNKLYEISTIFQEQTKPSTNCPLTNIMINNICDISATYTRGDDYFVKGKVGNLEFYRSEQRFAATVFGTCQYSSIAVVNKEGKILKIGCNCLAFSKYPNACKHVVAFLKTIQSKWNEYY